MGKRWVGLIFIMLVLAGVVFAFVHNGDVVSVRVDGYTMTLDEAFGSGYLNDAGNIASANGTVDFGVSYHDGEDIFVNVNGNELSLQDAIDGAGLCSNAAHSYSGDIVNGHSGGDIMVSGKSLQARINDREFCCVPQCSGKECGDDGCGGVCGVCSTCKSKCDSHGACVVRYSHSACVEGIGYKIDSCGAIIEPVTCTPDAHISTGLVCGFGGTTNVYEVGYDDDWFFNCATNSCDMIRTDWNRVDKYCTHCTGGSHNGCCDNDLDGYCGSTGHDCDDSNVNDKFYITGVGCSGITNSAFGCPNYLLSYGGQVISCQDTHGGDAWTTRTDWATCARADGTPLAWTLCV